MSVMNISRLTTGHKNKKNDLLAILTLLLPLPSCLLPTRAAKAWSSARPLPPSSTDAVVRAELQGHPASGCRSLRLALLEVLQTRASRTTQFKSKVNKLSLKIDLILFKLQML